MDLEGKDDEKQELKSRFESLSHAELVKRCSKFLNIAQSAKHAKDSYKQMLTETEARVKQLEVQLSKVKDDNSSLNVQCKECESKQIEEKRLQNQISAMQEMVATLTEQKLSAAMEWNDSAVNWKFYEVLHKDVEKDTETQINMDRLKKQNKTLESQLNDFAEENKKIRIQSDEQKITNCDERSELAERLEAGKKEVCEDSSHHQLCKEVEQLNRDLEVLSSDNKNKSEEIKRLSEKFYNEKCALEAELKSLSSKVQSLSHMNDYLKEQLRVVSEEKDVVLKGIESIKSNNFELNQLVESIGSERDECLHSVEKLNAEKSKLTKLVNALNNSKTTILEENVSLKSEKQHLNECLKKLTCERDSLWDSITSAEMHLSKILDHAVEVLQNQKSRIVGNIVQPDEIDSDGKLELMELISTLANVLSKLYAMINSQCSYEPYMCHSMVDASIDKQIECNRFISSENSKENDAVRQELSAVSLHLNKLYNISLSFRAHEGNSDVDALMKQAVYFLKSKVSSLETELESQCKSALSINTEQLTASLPNVEEACLEEEHQLDNNVSYAEKIVPNTENNGSKDHQITPGSSEILTANASEGNASFDSDSLQSSDSFKQYVCTQTENIINDSMRDLSEKCVQTDVHNSLNSLVESSFIEKEGEMANVTEDSNVREHKDDEKVVIELLKDQLQALHVKYQEASEKLTCTEKELEMLQYVVDEKDADMNKLLDILLCFDAKNSKNAMNQIFEKLQKVNVSCDVENIDSGPGNLVPQNGSEQCALLEGSKSLDGLNVHDGDLFVSDEVSSPVLVQNVADLQKIVSKKKTEILQMNELKALSETQSETIIKQEKDICCLNKTIEELTKAIAMLEKKIMVTEMEKEQSYNSEAEGYEISGGNESGHEEQDPVFYRNNEYSQLMLTFNKQKDELFMFSLKKLLDERKCEISHLKTKLEDVTASREDSNRSELSKFSEERVQHMEKIEAHELENTKERVRSKSLEQDILDKDDEIDGGRNKVEDSMTINKTLEYELLEKQKVIDEQISELSSYKLEVQSIENQVQQLSEQLIKKEEIIVKLSSDVENYKKKTVGFEHNFKELENATTHHLQIITDKDKEIEMWKTKIEGLEGHLKELEVDLVEKQQMCAEKVNEIALCRRQIDQLEQNIREMEHKLIHEQQVIIEKDAELEKLNNRIVVGDSNIEMNEKKIEDIKKILKETVVTKDAEIEELRNKCFSMQHILSEVKDYSTKEKQLIEQKDKDTENHRKQIENIMQRCMDVEMKLAQKQHIINELNETVDEYKHDIKNMQERTKETETIQKKFVDDMNCEIERLQNDLSTANALCADQKIELSKILEELCSVKNVNSLCEKKLDEMTEELNNAKLEAAEKEDMLTEKIQEIEYLQRSKEVVLAKLHAVGVSLRALRASHDNLLRDGQQLRAGLLLAVGSVQQELCRQVEGVVSSSKMEVKELLGEMNEMNQVLKQRGETISKLKELKTELEQRWESVSSELLANQETLSERTLELEKKEDKIRVLEEHLEALETEQQAASREQQELADAKLRQATERIAELESRISQLEQERDDTQKEGGEVQSEVMSSSTISKMEETYRLRDLEGSFEERFTKLRIFTVKLKKKASDLKEQLAQTEAEKSKLMSEKAELLSKISVLSTHTKNLQTLQQEYDSLQDHLEAQKSEVKLLKKTLEAAVTESTAVKLELENCKEEKESLSRELENYSKGKQKLDTSVKELLSQVQNLKKEKEAETIARKESEIIIKRLEEALKLKEAKMLEETEKAQQLQNKIEESKHESVKNNVLSLEMAACEDQLRMVKSQHRELAALVADHECTIEGLKRRLEEKTEQCENVILQLAELASEKQNLLDTFRSEQELLTRMVHSLEEESAKLKDRLAEREEEVANLRDEYESYKVRAQSVLRQKSRGDEMSQFSREDLLEETRHLKIRVDTLQARLEETNSHLRLALSEQDALKEEKTALLERCQDLADNLSRTHSQVHQLQEAEKNIIQEHQDALRNQKLQHDTLTQCYKSQIEDLEARLKDETVTLKQRLEVAEGKVQRLRVAGSVDTDVLSQGRNIGPDGKLLDPAKAEVEISLLKREDAEGSESTNSVSPNHVVSRDHFQHPMPLDKLLASSDDDNTMVAAESVSSKELTRAMDQVAVSEQQVRHLSALLSDAEQDLAKLTQQNGLLKEEIRRQQRSVEREQHAQNLEYLKNVVVKFATLQSGDERSRLVPVLNTILKLSPEETSQLAQVARGGLDSSGSARGWGSYLHLWPSTQ